MKKIIYIVIGLLVLDLYFQLVPRILQLEGVFWVVFAVLFFPIAHLVGKATGLKGIRSFGYTIYGGWWKHLLTGFGIGFVFWGLLYFSMFLLGIYSFQGFVELKEMVWIIVQGLIGFFLGSTINDAITRGYIFAHFRGKAPAWLILLISIFIYSLEDAWNEGFSIHNIVFSIVVGLTLGYSFLKTNAIWFSTGIHYGLNMMYCLLYGVGGTGGIIIKERTSVDSVYGILSLLVPALMLLFVLFYFYVVKKKENRSIPSSV